ncbi:soluble lytic murein transglycosylase-like protein [Inhella inkyongensis]|uniref:Soluble lytic murein transglycosylase-like protein n=1 Tax=Inhella inkyongensis TaxID=392593 RepID=A0A840S2A2_9BURK|nr:transglycosylase SLT domain-containing protein [Inhella inkyongensis]MBB5204435.1 soluble lytic murein transglycosylase-like protein [Inhella inkyongensis]
MKAPEGWRPVRAARLQRLAVLVLLVAWAALLVWPMALLAQTPAAAAPYRAELTRAAHLHWGLDAPVAALAAQVHQESGWRPQAVSHVGAQGLAQFMPATAKWWCELHGLSALDCQPANPTWALRALAGYDRWLFDRAPPQYAPRERIWVALRAYNGGLGHWQAERRVALAAGRPDTPAAVDAACGQARRAALHCAENLGYPHRILNVLQPRYASWGAGL